MSSRRTFAGVNLGTRAMLNRDHTIAAVATAQGPAALGIIRISGPLAGAVIDAVVPKVCPSQKPRRVLSGVARRPGGGDAIDRVLCFFCSGPNTATGEDTAEIHGHGGPFILKTLLNAVLQAGARVAEPGEFTYRAYCNGKIDLTQAEAVMGIIGAQSERAARVAFGQLKGNLGKTLGGEFEELTRIAAHVEAGLDFPDEDLPLEESLQLARRLGEVHSRLSRIRDSYQLGARLTQGAKVAIVGPPNAGKSSLLNKMVGEDRALVDSDPGTTRDIVEAKGEAMGVPITFLDTAGLRTSDNRVEKLGIEKSVDAATGADAVIIVVDGTGAEAGLEDFEVAGLTRGRAFVVINKKDLAGWRFDAPTLPWMDPLDKLGASALTGEGIDEIFSTLGEMIGEARADEGEVLTTARQHAVVEKAADHVKRAKGILKQGRAPELAATELMWARESLAGLFGRSATEEMLDTIFSEFCIGK